MLIGHGRRVPPPTRKVKSVVGDNFNFNAVAVIEIKNVVPARSRFGVWFRPPGKDAFPGSIKVIEDRRPMVDPTNLDVTFVIWCGRFGEGKRRNTGVVRAEMNGLGGFHPGARLWVRNDHVDVFQSCLRHCFGSFRCNV
jgi:hypothetical protein